MFIQSPMSGSSLTAPATTMSFAAIGSKRLMIDMSTLSPEDAAELQGHRPGLMQINSHEANQSELDAALERLTNILIKIGVRTAPEEKKSLSPLFGKHSVKFSARLCSSIMAQTDSQMGLSEAFFQLQLNLNKGCTGQL